MSLPGSSRASVRVPLIAGILPSPLVISPPHSKRSQSTGASLHLLHQPRGTATLCKDLWTHWGNAQAIHCIAVDARGCGKVDNCGLVIRLADVEPALAVHQVHPATWALA